MKVCRVHLEDWANGGYVDDFFTCGELILAFWEVGPILWYGYGI